MELLVVIAIVAILAAVLAVVMPRMIEKSRTTGCMQNLRQVGVLMSGFASEHNGFFPAGAAQGNRNGYIRQLCADSFADAYPNKGGPEDQVFFEKQGGGHFFLCPSHFRTDPAKFGKSYLGNAYILGAVTAEGQPLNPTYKPKPLASINDTSRTLLVIEDWRRDGTKLWGGNDLRYKPTSEADNFDAHAGGRHYLFVDGHVEMIVKDPGMSAEGFEIYYKSTVP